MDHPASRHSHCLNCQAPLHGPFCAQCGQEAHHSARSLRTLLHEAFESLTHLDGRLWRTMRALLFQPGTLTVEYLADRRVGFIPPFRLYLVISLLFFAFALATRDTANDEPGPGPGDGQSESSRRAQKLYDACDDIRMDDESMRKEARDACRQAAKAGAPSATSMFLQVLPKTMFLFLPVVAFSLFVLFFRARRFYVEHLVFTLHLHAAMYLFVGVGLLFTQLARFVPFVGTLLWVLFPTLFGLMGWYTWRSLRTVYRQGWLLTALKMGMFGFAYGVMLGTTMLGALIVSAMKG